MRLRVAITTTASHLPWPSVLAPGRGIVYDLLGRFAPEVGRRLHGEGQGPYGMVPFGHGAPVFRTARRVRGRYAAGGPGVVEFGSPLPEVGEALAKGFAERELLDWGGVALRLTGLEVVVPPDFESGRARWRTATPVVVKGPPVWAEGDENGPGKSRDQWMLPDHPQWPAYLVRNLRRKAETLGLDAGVQLEGIAWVGAQRSFVVGGGLQPGAAVEVEVTGPPETLRGLWSWGLGVGNSAGFGWVGV